MNRKSPIASSGC